MRKLRTTAGFVLAATLATPRAQADDGFFSPFFDRNGLQCSGSISSGGIATLYVLLVPNGATYGGIAGAELRVTTSSPDIVFTSESYGSDAVALPPGGTTAGGVAVGFPCRTGNPIQVLSLQALAAGPARDAEIRVTARQTPANPNFACPSAILCDVPVYTQVCAGGGKAIVNASQQRPCGSTRESSEWTRVKEFYR
jgi:hypothetical protein